jgi:hypothetical protein
VKSAKMKKIILLWLILAGILEAQQVVRVIGRVDRQPGGSTAWGGILAPGVVNSNDLIRLQKRSILELQNGLTSLEFHGPAKARIQNLLSAKPGASALVVSEFQGLMRFTFSRNDSSSSRILCGSMALQEFRGKGRLLCSQEQGELLIWMDSGSVMVQKGENYGITLESGTIWRLRFEGGQQSESFVDSAWAAGFLSRWLEEDPVLVRGEGDEVRVVWDGKKVPPFGRWNMGEYLETGIRAIPGLGSKSEKAKWTLSGRLERVEVSDLEEFWTLHVVIHFTLDDASMPFKKREIIFDKSYRLSNMDPNTLDFLKILPLDHTNRRIQASILGTLTQDVRKFLQAQVVDPFGRSGMGKP